MAKKIDSDPNPESPVTAKAKAPAELAAKAISAVRGCGLVEAADFASRLDASSIDAIAAAESKRDRKRVAELVAKAKPAETKSST